MQSTPTPAGSRRPRCSCSGEFGQSTGSQLNRRLLGTNTLNACMPGALHRNISLAQLQSAFGDEAPCKMFIYNWFAEFKRGRVNFSDEFRDGHPYTAVNNKNIDSMRRMIETDKHVTYHGI
ncbi:Putative uncharacterized protein FLJ37770 [Eumeta japonica]|uniref:Mos1 transposase HTH domain-containing protein n=1 Tax=Eumeta variegata TaxID=151549 RepID=A0A4C1XTQ8_EUMVA|nr:Putative uncharacterized protein FLJ37770 [Eumeta japonica]